VPLRPSLLLLTALAVSCAPSLLSDYPFDGQGASSATGPLVAIEAVDDAGLTTMQVNAADKASQVYVDLDQGREMKVDEAFSTNGWELTFKRVAITENGGTTNPTGTVEVAALKPQRFEALTRAPATGYLQDGSQTVFNGAQGGWYSYTLSSHGVNPQSDLVYVVKSSAGAYFKLQILDYYDAAKTSGIYTLQYAPLLPP
jgi:HmuY protein